MDTTTTTQKATFAGGCFWCTEAVFQQLDGVTAVKSGYIGGKTDNPTYESVCSGESGHAEAIEITYDPSKTTYEELLRLFFATHDPTTLNRQGNDLGTQYRSEVFYHDDAQKEIAKEYITQLNQANLYGKQLVTQLSPASKFYEAEDYHQNYYNRNPNAGYCQFVVAPKIEKAREWIEKVKQ